jgi:DMSO/TMAO reductase YedYZ molybdopterin-dependent catalytic subunit
MLKSFWIGAGAGCTFVAVELLGRFVAGVPTLPELIQDRLVLLLPGPVFSFVLDRLLYLGKPSLFVGLLLLQVVLGGLIGLAVARWGNPLPTSLLLWLLTGLVVLPLAGTGVFAGSLGVAIVTLAAFGLYATALASYGETAPARPEPAAGQPSAAPAASPEGLAVSPSRRLVIGSTISVVASLIFGRAVIGNLPSVPPSPSEAANSGGAANAATPVPAEVAVTSPESFYVVSKNIVDPVVDVNSWHLSVEGMVSQPLNLSYADIQTFPVQEAYRTLECISNEVGGDLMSNGMFTGVRLADVLQKAGVQSGATTLNFTAVDGYSEFMDLSKALDPTTLLVYKLDGQPLPAKHGAPLRVLGVGTYGMKNPKWLTKISVAKTAEAGFWESQGWDPGAIVQTMSRIDLPHDGDAVRGNAATVQGVAFAGARGIQKVEVSADGGSSWQTAELEKELGPNTWTLWKFGWAPVKAGRYTLVVRATDGAGQLQTNRQTDTFPTGATGYHQISVQVES